MLFCVLENAKQRDGMVTMPQEIQSDSELASRGDSVDKWWGKVPQGSPAEMTLRLSG